jgi:N-acetylglucosamine kinase-like BadF-type ATPase
MAGVDFPREEERLAELVHARGWAHSTSVLNDTFAVLRAGTEDGWGVAVVCGAGINCVGVAPDGRQVRFPALGAITGDWGGGFDVGLTAVSKAARSFDGRGRKTTLERAVPAHYGFETPYELAEAIHRKEIAERRVLELSPIVFAEAEHDEVAAEIVDRLADEVVALAWTALSRLDLETRPVEVLLGGGLLSGQNSRVVERIRDGLRERSPVASVRVTGTPPIVGATLLALDSAGAGREAQERVRAEVMAAAGVSDG